MEPKLSISSVIAEALAGARRVALPTLPFALGFAVALAILVVAAATLPDGFLGFALFASLAGITLFAHNLFSAAMYHRLGVSGGALPGAAWKLSLAWILVMVVASIGGSIILLFFSLIGSSLGVVAGEAGQEITDMTAQMRANGTFYPLFAVFIMTLLGLFWFATRLMLFAAATVAHQAVHLFRTWYWTKGHIRTLAPAMIIVVVLPNILLVSVAIWAAGLIPNSDGSPLLNGVQTALAMLVLTPGAWLGHGLAAKAYQTLAPSDPAES